MHLTLQQGNSTNTKIQEKYPIQRIHSVLHTTYKSSNSTNPKNMFMDIMTLPMIKDAILIVIRWKSWSNLHYICSLASLTSQCPTNAADLVNSPNQSAVDGNDSKLNQLIYCLSFIGSILGKNISWLQMNYLRVYYHIPRIQLSVRPFACPHFLHASYIVKMIAWVTRPERPKDEVKQARRATT